MNIYKNKSLTNSPAEFEIKLGTTIDIFFQIRQRKFMTVIWMIVTYVNEITAVKFFFPIFNCFVFKPPASIECRS